MGVTKRYKKRPMEQGGKCMIGGVVLDGKSQWGSLQPVLDRLPILQSVSAMARAVIG
jgi:hypothetical protein